MSEFTDAQRNEIKEIFEEVMAERWPEPKLPTEDEIKFLRDSALEAMTRRMPNHSNRPTASVYILYEAAAAMWACNMVNVPGVMETVRKWNEIDREEPVRPPHDPKAYLPLTTSDGLRPHPERFPNASSIDLDAPIPKETWPCSVDAKDK